MKRKIVIHTAILSSILAWCILFSENPLGCMSLTINFYLIGVGIFIYLPKILETKGVSLSDFCNFINFILLFLESAVLVMFITTDLDTFNKFSIVTSYLVGFSGFVISIIGLCLALVFIQRLLYILKTRTLFVEVSSSIFHRIRDIFESTLGLFILALSSLLLLCSVPYIIVFSTTLLIHGAKAPYQDVVFSLAFSLSLTIISFHSALDFHIGGKFPAKYAPSIYKNSSDLKDSRKPVSKYLLYKAHSRLISWIVGLERPDLEGLLYRIIIPYTVVTFVENSMGAWIPLLIINELFFALDALTLLIIGPPLWFLVIPFIEYFVKSVVKEFVLKLIKHMKKENIMVKILSVSIILFSILWFILVVLCSSLSILLIDVETDIIYLQLIVPISVRLFMMRHYKKEGLSYLAETVLFVVFFVLFMININV